MRKLLATVLLLAATATPATADPVADLYNTVHAVCPRLQPDPTGWNDLACGQFDLRYHFGSPMGCSVVKAQQPDGSYTFIFAGATAYSPWATEITTLCWISTVSQWKAIQIVPGPASVMLPQRFPGMPAPGDGTVCNQFRMRFAAGNPWGLTPGVEYSSGVYC